MKLSLPQEDIYYEQLIFPNTPIYNIGAKILIKGRIDFHILNTAYKKLINQHDSFRIVFPSNDTKEFTFLDSFNTDLNFIDFANYSDPDNEANKFMQEEFLKCFHLGHNNLLHKFILIKVNIECYYLFSVYHHIITDGWGTSLMFQRLVKNYNEIFESGKIQSSYPFSYKDFISDNVSYLTSESWKDDKSYWVQRFGNLPDNLFKKNDTTLNFPQSKRKELIIPRSIYNRLYDLADESKSSAFHILLGILFTYLSRQFRSTDISIGLPVLNRKKFIFKNTVGLFMGVSPLRMKIYPDQDFYTLILHIKNQLKQDYRHQRYPLGKLIGDLKLFQNKEKLFNIIMSYEKQGYTEQFSNTETHVIPLTHNSERSALAIYVREFDESKDVKIDFDYNLNYFNEYTITQFTSHFLNIIHSIILHPNQKLSQINFLTSDEQHTLLEEFNKTEHAFSETLTIIDLFKKQVHKHPNILAFGNSYENHSYLQAHKLSNQMAAYFEYVMETSNDSPVALLLDKSPDLIIVLLALFKSGRSYLPLDKSIPLERLNYIISNSAIKSIICDEINLAGINEYIRIFQLDEIKKNMTAHTDVDINKSCFNNLAYVMYTSGSTGKPKGVEIRHSSLVNFLLSFQNSLEINEYDKLFSVTTYTFDISLLEFFLPLISGSFLFIADNKLPDLNKLIEQINEIKPSIIQATPAFYKILFNSNWQGGKELKLLCGGDSLNENLAGALLQNSGKVWQVYGPTETTIWSTIKKLEDASEYAIIGKPIWNTEIYILDDYLNIQSIGVTGRIYISGMGLSSGYVNNHDLTSEKFIPNPFKKGRLMYNTGDTGRWLPDGNIEFIGREDYQVKIRGFRIELGEIENTILTYTGIEQTVVVNNKNDSDEFLIVYYVASCIIDKLKLKGYLSLKLPDYMIPNFYVELKEIPLTSNDKIDRKLLPQVSESDIIRQVYEKPNTLIEKQLLPIWKDILTIEEISVNDSFFELGGNSLKATLLLNQILKIFNVSIELKELFSNISIKAQAKLIDQSSQKDYMAVIIPRTNQKNYPLSNAQYAVWLSAQSGGNLAYNMPGIYSFEGDLDYPALESAFQEVIDRHEILRTVFKKNDQKIIRQYIKKKETVHFKIICNNDFDSKKNIIQKVLEKNIQKPFNLEKGPLIRAILFKTDTQKWVFFFAIHHIISDGWSLRVLVNEVLELYESYSSKKIIHLPPLKFQYKDFANWQKNKVESNQLNESKMYWHKQLFDLDPIFDLSDKMRPHIRTYKGHTFIKTIDPNLCGHINNINKLNGCTTFMTLLSFLNLLLYKYSNKKDIAIGSTLSGRINKDFENQIGCYTNTVVLRSQFTQQDNLNKLLEIAKQVTLEANLHQEYPFELLVTKLNIERDIKRNPLFDIYMVLHTTDFITEKQYQVNGLTITEWDQKINTTSKFDLSFIFIETISGIELHVEYNTDLFDNSFIVKVTDDLETIMNCVLKRPDARIEELIETNINNYHMEVSFNAPISEEF